MKRFMAAMGIVMFLATQAPAIDSGPGGTIYFSEGENSGRINKFQIKRLTLNADWTLAGSEVNVDNVLVNNTYTTWSGWQRRNSLEILDPTHLGGTGQLIQPAQVDNSPGNSQNYEVPWDILKINPSDWSHTKLCNGVYVDSSRNTRYLLKAVAAPENWAGTSNGISLATVRGIWSADAMALYDAGGNGIADDSASEIKALGAQTPAAHDAEMGGDGAFYYSAVNTSYLGSVLRTWVDAGGAPHKTTYYTIGGATNPVSLGATLTGLAVGPGASNPIVYLMSRDNDGAGNRYISIFALKDGDGDNVVNFNNPNDIVSKVWRRGDFGITPQSSSLEYGGADIEFYRNPGTGDMFLLANNWYNDWWVVQLADNGLSAVDGKVIKMGGDNAIWGPSNYGGFELDFNYIEGTIPEPATLLLFGTGALGVMGWMRRRRMK